MIKDWTRFEDHNYLFRNTQDWFEIDRTIFTNLGPNTKKQWLQQQQQQT